jgi:ribosomal protein S18 acetylase RimI-like enzyme
VPSTQDVPVKKEEASVAAAADGAPVGRDEMARREFASGVLRTELVGQSPNPQHLEYLLELKNIFSRQLPKMPRDYIVRLVFDQTHRTCALIKHDKIIGGICFRTFPTQSFIEIAFCAITATEQVRGYGTHMMNHLKEYMRKEKIFNFLTFADNFAIGYFKKQGFTREIRMPTKWVGYIKDYDGGTLMHCIIHPNINYLEVPGMVKSQRECVRKKVELVSTSHVVYPGLNFEGATGPLRIPIHHMRGTKADFVDPVPREQIEKLHTFLCELFEQVKTHESSWPFAEPVDPEEVPDYPTVIKDPIDLTLIDSRLRSRKYYIVKEIFLADIKRMCDNCRKYNREDTPYYECANSIEQFVVARFRRIKEG